MNRFLPFAILILMTAACSRHEARVAAAGAEHDSGRRPGRDRRLIPRSPISTRQAARVRARYSAAIAAKIAANILEVRVQTGDHVQAGQTLIVLDRRDLEANLRRSEAARAEAESAIDETENAITAARANFELARVTHKRFQDLLANASVSQQEFDESQARLRSAEATLEMAASKRRQIEARRSQAEAEIAAARVALGYATLTAPFAALVTERKADPGSLATPGAPLLTLEREGNPRLEASIDESRLGLVRVGESVAVEIDGLNRTVSGRVAEIVPSVDAATRSFTVKIDLPALPGLRSGMFGRAGFAAGKREALLVPQSAVLERGQIRSVYVVEGDTARLRFVTLGEGRDDQREVLSGLTAGERIIVTPAPLLADGARVAIQEAAKVNDTPRLRAAGRLAAAFVNSKLTPLFVVASILLGVFAVVKLPREEEPQIIVPMIDIFVEMPGASAREVEERVTKPMEKLLWEIPGVEYIYSTSSPGMSMAVVRFFVGEDEEKAIVRLNQKMFANFDLIPPGASPPLIKPRSIDDVPILALTLWSKRYGDYDLRRLAAQLHDTVKQVDQVSAVAIIGGQRRQMRVDLDEARSGRLSSLALRRCRRARHGQPPPAGRQLFQLEPGVRAGGRLVSRLRR